MVEHIRIGLISDTHGLLRPQAIEFLRGCDHIIHAGDIGGADILRALSELAPTTAVRGNNDNGHWAADIAETRRIRFGDNVIYVMHDLAALNLKPDTADVDVIISGHSHKPLIEWRGKVLFVNPGSAGPRRFKLPVSAGELIVTGKAITPRIVELEL